jgi:NAD-dependent SIR2 family protein deacetylase
MKTVFILGAGFSVDAGAPIQTNLISKAITLHKENPQNFNAERFARFKNFLVNQLNIPVKNIHNVDLEDIFTPLDRCLTESSQFRGIGLDKIMEVREAVFYVVGRTIQLALDQASKPKDYIDKFAKYLTDKSSARRDGQYKTHDPVSVISTNWDILLDNSIHQAIVNGAHNAVVDYCCYISSIDEFDHTIKPGLEKLGEGGFNVKLLKLHGSLNWIQCPRCMRLYARFFWKNGVIDYTNRGSCRHCDANFPEEKNNHLLSSNLIMPTYIKDLSNPQYKIIWQNAGIEISEADKLVFIGYSLPTADFEMRQLLARMTRTTAIIEVVELCSKTDQKEKVKNHWEKFFGKRSITFHFHGAKRYIDKMKDGTLATT